MEKQKLWTDDPNEDLRQSGHGAEVMWDAAARTVFKSVAAIVHRPPRLDLLIFLLSASALLDNTPSI